MRRMRKAGKIPAVLYGHGEDVMMVSIPTRDVDLAVRHGNQIVEIGGAASGSALIKDVQWDAFGSAVLHMDLARVDATELVEVTLNIELKGTAPGTKTGGTVKHVLSEITIACPANALPDKLELSINNLELDQSLTVKDLDLPEGASVVSDDSAMIVQCVEESAAAEEEEAEATDGPSEPEVIGGKKEEDGEADG